MVKHWRMKSNINKKHAPLKKVLQRTKSRKISGERIFSLEEGRRRGHKIIKLCFEGKLVLENPFLPESRQ